MTEDEIAALCGGKKAAQRLRKRTGAKAMSDIVERLRAAYLSGPDLNVLDEAADEIGRLRALLHEAWAVMPPCPFRERVRRALEQKP